MAVGTPKRLPKGGVTPSKPASAKKEPISSAKKAKTDGGAGQKEGGATPAGRTPVHSIKLSKKGLVWVHVTLPRSVPLSVINLDAKTDSLHIDTGKVTSASLNNPLQPPPPQLPSLWIAVEQTFRR